MNILVANDDGIKARGIAELTKALALAGHDIYVVAPTEQRSAFSHALSMHGDIVIRRTENFPYAKETYTVSGTPADCVKIGLCYLKKKSVTIDMVCTGINHGGNLGTDAIYSGTVAAAAEGVLSGLPSMAVSVDAHDAEYFEAACKAAVKLLPAAYRLGTAEGIPAVVNINSPNLPEAEIKGILPAKLGVVKYDDVLFEAEHSEDGAVYRYAGEPVQDENETEEMDTYLIREGYITVAMIQYDMNDYKGLEILKKQEEMK